MKYDLTSPAQIEKLVSDIAQKYALSMAQVYLIESVCHKLKEDGKTSCYKEDVLYELFDMEDILCVPENLQNEANKMLEILDVNPDSKYVDSFCKFITMSETESVIDDILRHHTKQRKSQPVLKFDNFVN